MRNITIYIMAVKRAGGGIKKITLYQIPGTTNTLRTLSLVTKKLTQSEGNIYIYGKNNAGVSWISKAVD